ncbi:hypothetical protein BPNPMPFG_007656 (plasmid) [Mesorhizobium sp. AR07]|uniref:hypothetical protein n=1 Tax=Mesorhizobium sp. AR07 TaxID=2865838 RepID=UPI00215EEA12|nr:hypothetical protein [Mesorhizobium sp. AR07]UVK48041.1 hypothetical protein BPNPMPFG_007656 [Mesorhizobium sp. AR07]
MLIRICSVISSAVVAGIIGYAVGFPVSKYFDSHRRMRLLIAPVIGLGTFGAAGVSIFHLLSLTAVNLYVVVLGMSAVAFWLSSGSVEPLLRSRTSPGLSWLAASFLLCLLPTLAIIPQYYGESASLGYPIWDHAKIAIIDEIAQNGLPPRNPFYSEAGSQNTLIYHYVWYFIAACLSVLTGATGWEADIALTGMTAFFSTLVLAWLAVARSSCANAAWWILPLLLVSSLKPVVQFVSGNWLDTWMVRHSHFQTMQFHQTWIFAVTWAPQHVFSGTLALIAIMAYTQLLYCNAAPRGPNLAVVMGAILASAYGSSTWAGGFSLLLILPIVGVLSISHLLRADRMLEVSISLSIAAAITVLCAGVLIHEQVALLHYRRAVEFWVLPVFIGANRLLDLVSYWLVLLALDFGVIFVGFIIWSFAKRPGESAKHSLIDRALIVSILAPLFCAQFLRSVLLYNDLGWDVVIPSILAMVTLTSELFSRHIGGKALLGRLTTTAAVVLLTPSILAGARFVYSSAFQFGAQGSDTEGGRAFRASPQMWEAVREVTPTNEAVANNPLDFANVTAQPGNIAWAVLSQRRNCATSLGLIRSYAAQLTPKQASDVFNFFVGVFEGSVTEEQLRVMKEKYLCETLVVTTRDGLWGEPVLDNSSIYKLVSEEKGKWRIYR